MSQSRDSNPGLPNPSSKLMTTVLEVGNARCYPRTKEKVQCGVEGVRRGNVSDSSFREETKLLLHGATSTVPKVFLSHARTIEACQIANQSVQCFQTSLMNEILLKPKPVSQYVP